MNNDVSKKKTSREKRVLIASLCIAAAVVTGSTFAWFSSKDEVTNRLSASAAYDVSIAEDFTPPENWVPGQTVDKNVGVVNTGNTDAFVRTWLEGEMRLLAQTASATTADSMATATPTAVTDEQLLNANLTYKVDDVFLKELDNTNLIGNPDTQNTATPPAYTEVMSVQAGGELAYTSGTSYKFTPNQSISITNSAGAIQNIAANTVYTVTIDSSAADDITVTTSGASGTITLKTLSAFRNIDSNTFEPVSDGLYIFRRNVDMGTTDDYEFSGYYVKTIDSVKHYFALEYDNTNQRSDYVLGNDVVTVTIGDDKNYTIADNGIKMFTASQTLIENSGLTWTYDTNLEKFTVKRAGDTTSNLAIDVQLSNIGTTAEKWTVKNTDGAKYTFYYNNDLEEGATTSQFVDSLTLSANATQNDYIAFDFDLNVFMESVQVPYADYGNESFTSVAPWAGGSANTGATGGEGTVTNGEIELIAWS